MVFGTIRQHHNPGILPVGQDQAEENAWSQVLMRLQLLPLLLLLLLPAKSPLPEDSIS